MGRLIIFLIILIASVWIGIEIVRHPGYLLMTYDPWMVQMPIWFALICLILAFVLFYFLINSIDQIHFLWFRLKNWLRFRREHQSYSKTQHGLSLLIEGEWKKAEKLLLAGLNQSYEPLINYLGAAKAAHEQRAYERRDSYIQKAYEVAPKADLSIGLLKAELELSQDQLEHAVATLNHLKQTSPRHPRVLKLLERAYIRLGDWKNLLNLLPQLRKVKVVPDEEFGNFEQHLFTELLQTDGAKTLDDLHHIWDQMPRSVRKNPEVVKAYVKQLLPFTSAEKEIEELIRKTLKYHWQPELVKIYSNLHFTNYNKALAVLGAWMKQYGQRPELLLALGKICVRIQLWGKAKTYFEECLSLGPNPEAAFEHGKLLEHLDQADNAREIYRDALAQQVSEMINTPC